MGVKIDNCELGQFGGLENGRGKYTVMTQLKQMTDEKGRILCKDARDAAVGVGLKTIRGALKDYKIDVKYCQLGCFKEKKGKKMRVKTKTWIENDEGELIFGKGKTEVLDVIAEVGSISKAAEILGMNYKKCWNHLQILQKNLKEELFTTKQGGGNAAALAHTQRKVGNFTAGRAGEPTHFEAIGNPTAMDAGQVSENPQVLLCGEGGIQPGGVEKRPNGVFGVRELRITLAHDGDVTLVNGV